MIDRAVEVFWDALLTKASADTYIGMRADSAKAAKKFRNSWNRPDGGKTTRLPGVCALLVGYDLGGYDADCLDSAITKDALRLLVTEASRYGANLYLIEGEAPSDIQHLANDPGERIFTSHTIIARLEA